MCLQLRLLTMRLFWEVPKKDGLQRCVKNILPGSKNALTEYKGGRSYVGFLDRARKMALASVDPSDFEKYDELSGGKLLSASGNDIIEPGIQPEGPGKRWTVDEALAVVDNLGAQDYLRGKAMYQATLCQSCHTMQGEGGIVGPDLTQLGTRFSKKRYFGSYHQSK